MWRPPARGTCCAEYSWTSRWSCSDGSRSRRIAVAGAAAFGHLNGDYVHRWQPAKFAAIEARWHDEQPASEVLIAIPDGSSGGKIASRFPSRYLQLDRVDVVRFQGGGPDLLPAEDRPPVLIPFFAFRVMAGCGVVLLVLGWWGSFLLARGRVQERRKLLWLVFLSFPLPFIATLTGWFTAEVGAPAMGRLRAAPHGRRDNPFAHGGTGGDFAERIRLIYALIFAAGTVYIFRLLKAGPTEPAIRIPAAGNPKRPLALADGASIQWMKDHR